ncbi:MAG: GNAT family N-acetyltransferase [Pseudomonadota bacterium]
MSALRPARPEDALACGAILSAFIDGTDWMPRLHSRAEDIGFCGMMIDRGWVTVAGQPAQGFLAREDAFIHALYVAPDRQGRGIGKALLDAAKAAPRLELWTFQANLRAQAFYRREGFTEAERTDGARNDEGLPDIRFTWGRSA